MCKLVIPAGKRVFSNMDGKLKPWGLDLLRGFAGITILDNRLPVYRVCTFLKPLSPALSRRERGQKPHSVPFVEHIDHVILRSKIMQK